MDTQSWMTLGLALLVGWFLIRGFLGKVSPTQAKEVVAAGGRLLDVRTDSEHRARHIPGSLHIPVSELSSRIGELDKSKPVVVYCASGVRSASAAGILKRAGFSAVHDLGAMGRWPG